MTTFNPFERSKMKFVEPVALVGFSVDQRTGIYHLGYRASRGAANMGLLSKQFAVGKPLVMGGNTLIVREVNLSLTNGTVDEVTIRVVAVDLVTALNGVTPVVIPPTTNPGFGETVRRILK